MKRESPCSVNELNVSIQEGKLDLIVAGCCPLVSNRCSSIRNPPQPLIFLIYSCVLEHLYLTQSCGISQVLCCSIPWTTQRNGGMCSSAPVNVPSGWIISAVERGTRSSWPPRTAWAQGASVRSLRPRLMEEVRGGHVTYLTLLESYKENKLNRCHEIVKRFDSGTVQLKCLL